MLPECQAFRDEFLAAGLPSAGAPGGGALWEHGGACAPCGAWAHHAVQIARALVELPRPALPAELEGRVVAALQAGHRQARAARAVAELGRVSSPPALDEAVDAQVEGTELEGADLLESAQESDASEGLTRLQVPGVLERLVAEELAAPSPARARRYLGSLRRLRAPEDLRLRLGLALADRGGFLAQAREGVRPGRRPGPVALRSVLGLAAAALLVTLGALVLQPAPQPTRGRTIVIERVADPADLPSFAAALLDGASGGLLTVEGL